MPPEIISALLGAGASVVGTGASLLSSGNLNSRNRKWNAQQAQLNRDFQSQEAEIARQWQEDMYNQYYSPQAQIGQQMQGYKENGINPALMFGQNVGAGAMPSTSAPSGSQASGNFSSQPDFANIMAVAKDIAMTRAQIDNLQADTNEKEQNVFESISRENLNNAVKELTKEQIIDVQISANLKAQQAKTESAKQEYYIAEAAIKKASKVQIDLENALSDAFFERTGTRAPASTINQLMLVASNILGDVVNILPKFAMKKAKGGK